MEREEGKGSDAGWGMTYMFEPSGFVEVVDCFEGLF